MTLLDRLAILSLVVAIMLQIRNPTETDIFAVVGYIVAAIWFIIASYEKKQEND